MTTPWLDPILAKARERAAVITCARMDWALFDGLRTDDPVKGLRALDLVFAYFEQRGGNLTTGYNALNRTHFHGALPRYRVRREPMEPLTHGPAGALKTGHCWDHRALIVIGYGLSPRHERRLLLHEMAHVASLGSVPIHGPAFRRELLRLAGAGERWARREAMAYERVGDAHYPWIPRRAGHIVELWRKHGAAWREREHLRRSRAARRGASKRALGVPVAGTAGMSKARGVTMPRAIVPYIRRFATATTSPRARFVLMHGQVWKLLGQRPAGMRLGRAKGCYKNATNAVLDCPAWLYVEGYAHHRLGVILEHAWAVDEQGRVIETTWPDAGTAYFGVAFDEAALRRAICATPCFCLLCRKALPRIAADYARESVAKK